MIENDVMASSNGYAISGIRWGYCVVSFSEAYIPDNDIVRRHGKHIVR